MERKRLLSAQERGNSLWTSPYWRNAHAIMSWRRCSTVNCDAAAILDGTEVIARQIGAAFAHGEVHIVTIPLLARRDRRATQDCRRGLEVDASRCGTYIQPDVAELSLILSILAFHSSLAWRANTV